MLEISSKPILLKVFPFGKYKKEKFEDVIKKDKPYFDWVAINVDMDENLKHTINYYRNEKRNR
jgi:exodeoxyribonuclease X